jgi:hypothetical protein
MHPEDRNETSLERNLDMKVGAPGKNGSELCLEIINLLLDLAILAISSDFGR